MGALSGKRIAIIATDGFEHSELAEPLRAFKEAGAEWHDEEVVVDQGLVTSRTPADLHTFITKTIEEIKERTHSRRDTVDPLFEGFLSVPGRNTRESIS